jgi:hypothetical protein
MADIVNKGSSVGVCTPWRSVSSAMNNPSNRPVSWVFAVEFQ